MDMEITILMGLAYLRGVYLIQPIALANLAGDIIIQALERVGHIGVFLNLPVQTLQVFVN